MNNVIELLHEEQEMLELKLKEVKKAIQILSNPMFISDNKSKESNKQEILEPIQESIKFPIIREEVLPIKENDEEIQSFHLRSYDKNVSMWKRAHYILNKQEDKVNLTCREILKKMIIYEPDLSSQLTYNVTKLNVSINQIMKTLNSPFFMSRENSIYNTYGLKIWNIVKEEIKEVDKPLSFPN